jgi:formylglycine-generating enzyme required for sulfatase activity
MALSDPEVAMLLHDRFVPVVFSMWMSGPRTDLPGRDFVIKDGHYPYPGLILTDPDLNVLARTKPTCSERDTLEILRRVLNKRPDLAVDGAELAEPLFAEDKPGEQQLRALWREFDLALQAERPRLAPKLRAWIDAHAAQIPEGEAMALTLLGDCAYIAGDFAAAHTHWQEVVDRFPDHPVRHRAWFNLLDKTIWPEETHHAIRSCPLPPPSVATTGVPDSGVRTQNLHELATNPHYVRSPSGMVLAPIPAGTFTMGGSPALYHTELPLRRVTLSQPYLIGARPVTRREWLRFRPHEARSDETPLTLELPQTEHTWNDVVAYGAWLSAQDGWTYRLATEAEWERAARGGLEGARYPWGNEPLDPTRANYNLPHVVPVASYPPNPYGLFDTLGNGGEYTADRFLGNAFSLTPSDVTDPSGPTPAQQPRNLVVVRASVTGHAFAEMVSYLSWRAPTAADRGDGNFTFRLVAIPPAASATQATTLAGSAG